MTGDGVNDSLALKEADCSIAMADGSEVARNLSNIVLLDSKFSSLPAVVKEGRQVINNVQQSSVLFLMKTTFTILLTLVAILTRSLYPFSPGQLLLLEMFVIGLPSFILAMQPNSELIKGGFLAGVLKRSLPNGLMLFFNVLVVIVLNKFGLLMAEGEFETLSTAVLIGTGFVNLVFLCKPFNILRVICVALSGACLLGGAIGLGGDFGLTTFTPKIFLIFIILIGASIPLHHFMPRLSDLIFEKIKNIDAKFKLKRQKRKEEKERKKKIKRNEIVLNDTEEE